MIYSRLKKLATAMLSGDNVLPDDEESMQVILQYALEEVALTAYSNVLTVKVENVGTRDIIKYLNPDTVVLRPSLPIGDECVIDIDEGLTYIVARHIAALLSSENTSMHMSIAKNQVERYNQILGDDYGNN